MSAFDKLEYELYAPLTLMHSFPQFVQALSKGESPDWQDYVHGIGIEVARAENKHLGYSKYIWNMYRGKHRGEIPTSVQSGYEGYLGFDDNNKLSEISPLKNNYVDEKNFDNGEARIGLIDAHTHIQLAYAKTNRKLKLLNSKKYVRFNTNCLYLYMTMSLLENDCYNYLEWYADVAKNQQLFFDHVFLMSFNEIFHINMNNYSVQKHAFSETELKRFDCLVHRLRREATWEEGRLFSMN